MRHVQFHSMVIEIGPTNLGQKTSNVDSAQLCCMYAMYILHKYFGPFNATKLQEFKYQYANHLQH